MAWLRQHFTAREFLVLAGMGLLGWGLWLLHPVAAFLGLGLLLLYIGLWWKG